MALKYSNRSGMSLVEVMVASSIMLVVLMGMGAMVTHITRQQTGLTIANQANNVSLEIQGVLKGLQGCAFSLGGGNSDPTVESSGISSGLSQTFDPDSTTPQPITIYQPDGSGAIYLDVTPPPGFIPGTRLRASQLFLQKISDIGSPAGITFTKPDATVVVRRAALARLNMTLNNTSYEDGTGNIAGIAAFTRNFAVALVVERDSALGPPWKIVRCSAGEGGGQNIGWDNMATQCFTTPAPGAPPSATVTCPPGTYLASTTSDFGVGCIPVATSCTPATTTCLPPTTVCPPPCGKGCTPGPCTVTPGPCTTTPGVCTTTGGTCTTGTNTVTGICCPVNR